MSGDLGLRHLRLVESARLDEYFDNTEYLRAHGNGALARRLVENGVWTSRSRRFQREYVAFHSWLPGFVELTRDDARNLALHIIGSATVGEHAFPASSNAEPLPPRLRSLLDEFGWARADSVDVTRLVAAAASFCPMQNPYELETFLQRIRARRLRTVVELGTGRGGMLYCLAQVADPSALIVSVDFPGGRYGGGQSDVECEVFRSFAASGQRMEFIRDRTFHWSTRRDLESLLSGRAIDLLVIDADHSYGAVKSDLEMYRSLVDRQGLLALHDICMMPEHWGRGHDVGLVWNELQAKYRTESVIAPDGVRTRAKRADQEYAFGFGLIDFAQQHS